MCIVSPLYPLHVLAWRSALAQVWCEPICVFGRRWRLARALLGATTTDYGYRSVPSTNSTTCDSSGPLAKCSRRWPLCLPRWMGVGSAIVVVLVFVGALAHRGRVVRTSRRVLHRSWYWALGRSRELLAFDTQCCSGHPSVLGRCYWRLTRLGPHCGMRCGRRNGLQTGSHGGVMPKMARS